MPVAPEPVARSYRLAMTPPSLEDPEADAERVAKALAAQHGISGITFDGFVLRSLSNVLRENAWQAKVVLYNRECVAVLLETQPALGLAVDLGTTMIALYLLDLETGQTLAT